MADTTADTGRELTTTSYAILGLLTIAPEISGYDLSKIISRSIGFFWTPARSQVYAELRRLAAAGHATERRVEQTDRPDKRLFAITPAGVEALRRWLERAPVELEPIRSTFLLKVFFGAQIGPEAVAAQVREYRRQMQELMEEFGRIEAEIPATHESSYPTLTLHYGIAWTRAAIAWCDDTLAELTKEEGGTKA
jgi:DNA-binding PadR family transcriptional regulator